MAVVGGPLSSCCVESIVPLQLAFTLLVLLDEAREPWFRVGISGRKLIQGEPERDGRECDVEATL